MSAEPAAPIPLGLRLAYTAFMVVWIPVYWKVNGPANFLWFCDLANFVMLAALWRQSALLVSSQAAGVLLFQALWILDAGGRLLFGTHPIGGTEYMFDPAENAAMRTLSLFHVFMPLLILWSVRRLGYDRRGWLVQTGLSAVVLPVCFLATDPELNINWVFKPFGLEQTWMAPAAYLGLVLVGCPAVVFFGTHLMLAARARRPK